MGIGESIILVLFLSVSIGFQLPGCQDQRIVFTAEPTDVETGCEIDDVAIFHCRYNGSSVRPQWIINSTIYGSLNSLLPPDHSYSNYKLVVRSGIKYNNTLYQCQLLPPRASSDGSLCAYRSSDGRLIAKCVEGFCARNELIATTDCVCSGQNFTYECSVNVVGGRFTVWRGTVISAGCEITLFHSEFGIPGAARGVCNNGAVVGYNIGVENNCYTSKLDILVSPGLNGRTVECIVDDGITETVINTSTLLITTTPFPPPTNVRLVRAMPEELTFSWLPPTQTCPSLTFNVISNDCGVCQNNSAFSNTTCREFTLPSTCTLTIQSIICGNLASTTKSSPVIARLNVPEAPTVVEVYPHYFDSNGRLLRLTVNFNTIQSFQIADEIDGSATSYTVIYSDSASGSICGSATIPSSSCVDEICTHSFDTSLSLCPSAANINVTVFATNVLGNGPTSEPTFQDGMNSFVDINFNSDMKTIVCAFLNQPMDIAKECFVNITYGPSCDQLLGLYINKGIGDSVSTPELPLIEGVTEYCFTVTARSNNVTVTVEGALNLIEVSNVIGITTAAVVVPVIVVFGVAVIVILLLLYYYQFRKSLILIRFSNPDKPGSLAEMLKVFKDNGVNIIRINTYWTEADVKWNLCGRRQTKESHIHISCTSAIKTELKAQSKINLDFIEDDVIQEDTDSVTTDSTKRARTVRFFMEDKPGALWEVMNEFGKRGINILGLNTRSNYDSRSGYKDNFVSCLCSTREQKNIVRALTDAGALNVEVEYNIKPSTKMLQFYVEDKPGALADALKAFRELNINTIGINPAYMNSKKFPTHDIPGYETIYVECDYDKDEREKLLEKLRSSLNDAINIQFHDIDDQQVISRKKSACPNYCIVKLSIRDIVGSLVSALEVFHDLNINIIGINSFDADPSINLRPEKKVEYKLVQMMVTSESDLKVPDLIDELQSSGHITGVECNFSDPPTQGKLNYDVQFLARHEVGTLAKALQILIEHNINIISLSQESVSRDVRYVHNHIRFVATNQQEVTLISKLRATGLVVDIDTFKWDEHHIAKMKESQPHHSTTKGEPDVFGNAFEREPLSAVTVI